VNITVTKKDPKRQFRGGAPFDPLELMKDGQIILSHDECLGGSVRYVSYGDNGRLVCAACRANFYTPPRSSLIIALRRLLILGADQKAKDITFSLREGD